MECGPSLDKMGEAIRYVCLQWATAGSLEEGHDVVEKGEDIDAVAAGEGYRVISFQSTVSTVHVAQANTAVHRLTREQPWSSP